MKKNLPLCLPRLLHFTFCLFTFYLILPSANSSAQVLQWANAMGGASNDYGRSIALDASGNVYTTGYFSGTADFDPGAGIVNLTSAGNSDIFISKLDASGNFLWARAMGGTSDDWGYSIAVDASGNVYTTGNFNGTADFDPGAGIVNLTSAGGTDDIFISKLDASGNFVWAKAMGGTGYDYGRSIALDASGNVYTTGYFDGTADFDPGAGIVNLTSAGFYDIFISKLDASGNFVWAKSMGGTGSDYGYSIAVDASGNVYTTGYFSGTADFDPGAGIVNLTSAGGTLDIFVAKYCPCNISAFTAADVSCNGGNNGSASANMNDGIPPYIYLWSNGQTNAAATGLIAGNYTVTVTSSTGCSTTAIVTISQPSALTASTSYTATACTSNSGMAEVTAAGGVSPYSYSWSDGQTTSVATGLGVGNYTVTVTDANACTKTATVAVTLASGMNLSTSKTNIDCSGNCIGSATVTATGGTAPYTYAWSSGETTSATNNNLCSGTYSVTVTDAGGCTMSASVTITTPTALSFSTAQVNVSCFGGNNGSISVNASGGAPAYQYSKDGGSNYQASGNFTGLTAGTYSVVVKDNNGCQTSITVITITEPNVLALSTSQTTADCYGGSNASATAIVSGGTTPYTYLWIPTAAATATATGLSPGNYSVTVTDNNNCTATASVTIVSSISNPVTCQVTVDSLSQYNVIIWDKPVTLAIDTFIIYRDTANNNFAPIGKVPYDSLSQFIDTVQSLYAANGDPNASTWKYKIAVMDTCGNISPISAYHKTLFIQNNSGNFTWNDYLIEGQPVPVPALSNYLFQRDDFSLGNYVTIQTLSASSLAYTDAAYSTYQATATWRVRTLWGISCSSQLTNGSGEKGLDPVPTATVNTTRSNTFKTGVVKVNEISFENSIHIYPNPSNGQIQVAVAGGRGSQYSLEIYNALGEKIYERNFDSGKNNVGLLPLGQGLVISLPSGLGQGIYFLKVFSDMEAVNRKIIIQ